MLNHIFAALPAAREDAILGLNAQFQQDPRPNKVNLTVGNYVNAEGRLPLQATVVEAERRMLARGDLHGYLPSLGLASYAKALERLTFGADSPRLHLGAVATAQAIGGTGALFLGAAFALDALGIHEIVIPNYSWTNHQALFEKAGLRHPTYRYVEKAQGRLLFDEMLEDLRSLPPKTMVLLQVCCHNPTGTDLTSEQWTKVIELVAERDLLPFFDLAYQGFAQGLEADAEPVRACERTGMNFLVSVSLSKSFSLYGERVGALHVASSSAREAGVIETILKREARTLYSNPPLHGAAVVAEILNDPQLEALWRSEVEDMRLRIITMRESLWKAGEALGVDLRFVREQHGIFSLTPFTAEEMKVLREEFGISGIATGRIAMAGFTAPAIDPAARAVAEVLARRGR